MDIDSVLCISVCRWPPVCFDCIWGPFGSIKFDYATIHKKNKWIIEITSKISLRKH